MKEHTYLVQEGRWQLAGSTVDVAENANVAIGYILVGNWTVEEQINEVTTHYDVAPLPKGGAATTFTGTSGIFGPMHGSFALFNDVILSTYRSDDGQYHGVESIRRVDADNYESRGALFLGGKHVSSWSLALTRA